VRSHDDQYPKGDKAGMPDLLEEIGHSSFALLVTFKALP
jgi:hypothetical protein